VGVPRPHHRKSHDLSRSLEPTADREYRTHFTNFDQQSSPSAPDQRPTWPGPWHLTRISISEELQAVLVNLPGFSNPDGPAAAELDKLFESEAG
jgi:hypothetical protein